MEKLSEFSLIERKMQKFQNENDFKKLNARVEPWSVTESTKEAVESRISKSSDDYWHFDKLYFTEDMYSDGYSEPAPFHRHLIDVIFRPGINIIGGPRKNGKTATMKKSIPWLLLSGKMSFIAVGSQTLTTATNILNDIVELLDNEKMKFDYGYEIIESNQDQATIYVPRLRKTCRILALSEGRSARGKTKIFDRPQFVFFDDLETRQSPMSDDQVIARVNLLKETYQSMSRFGSLVWVGNNFDERSALNTLLIQKNENLLPPFWFVEIFKAWDNGPLWANRYPAETENELREMLNVADESEWLGDFQQTPAKPDGFVFKRITPLPKWDELPDDARGVIWCDPNLSIKGKGDSTAILSLLYSPSKSNYYVTDLICRNYSDPDNLLTDYLLNKKSNIRYCGFDGNVTQESTWTGNVRNWCRIHQMPFPTIHYRRYKVDELTKNVQAAWMKGLILLPPNVENEANGKEFLKQLFAFRGKAAGKRDDGPDALISAFELLHEQKIGARTGYNPVKKITDFFNF